MELFKPKRYLQILQGIDKKLTGTQRLIIPATADNMWIYYQQTKVTTAVVQNSKTQQESLKLFLHVPVYETPYQFELHKVYNIPTFNSNSSHGLHYENIPEYIAFSTDLDKYLELNTKEIEQCTEINNRWICPIMKGFRRITSLNTTQSCIVALFQNSTSKNKLCTQVLTPWNGFYSHYLGKGKWLYSNLQETSVTYTCLDAKVKKLYTAIIDKSSLLKPPKGCTIRSSNWILPPTFKKQLIVPGPDTIDSKKIPDMDSWMPEEVATTNKSHENPRQQLLNNISQQLESMEQSPKFHQYTGMTTQRLEYLTAMVQKDLEWENSSTNKDMAYLSTTATITSFLTIAIFLLTWRMRHLGSQLQTLKHQLEEHERATSIE